ncbi:MAG: hypothetical protein KR126chlam6_00086 [Candidatus Anoxychlamydiales bacterium]|nr:hypothetical protein [Candidatus Anoxychlamydiales bacterium]
MTKKFKIIISSDQEYEELCAEIYFENQFVAIITQEKGFENLQISIYSPSKKGKWLFNLVDFQEILNKAKESLWEMRKSSEES